jgi:hypothetical protein
VHVGRFGILTVWTFCLLWILYASSKAPYIVLLHDWHDAHASTEVVAGVVVIPAYLGDQKQHSIAQLQQPPQCILLPQLITSNSPSVHSLAAETGLLLELFSQLAGLHCPLQHGPKHRVVLGQLFSRGATSQGSCGCACSDHASKPKIQSEDVNIDTLV